MLATERNVLRIATLKPFLWPAIQLDQIAFSFNSQGVPLACATWAYLTDDVGREVASDPGRLLDLGEWNEGANLWIIDVIAPFGHARSFLSTLAATRLARFGEAWGLRRNRDGSIRRVVHVRRGTTGGAWAAEAERTGASVRDARAGAMSDICPLGSGKLERQQDSNLRPQA